MDINQNYNPEKRQQFINKIEQLRVYVEKSAYIDALEQSKVFKAFDLHYLPGIFRNEYRKRFYNFLQNNTSTVATVSKVTNIPHKYLCECKAYYESRDLLKVVCFGICTTTGSSNVQFVSTNKDVWHNSYPLQKNNQLNLFEHVKK